MKTVDVRWGTWLGAVPFLVAAAFAFGIAWLFVTDDEAQVHPMLALIPAAVGVLFSTGFLARGLNTTRFTVHDGRLTTRTHPIPVGGRLDLPLTECARFEAQTRQNAETTRQCRLALERVDGERVYIPNNPFSREQAEAFAAELNRTFGLGDRKA